MQTGKLAIGRGRALDIPPAPAPRLSLVPSPEPEARPQAPDHRAVHHRLEALERLARLHGEGLLTAEEFAAEKAIVLGLPADILVPSDAEAAPARRSSLLGRLLDWRLIPFGLALGLALSYATQPQETVLFFDEALRLLGA